MPSPVQIVWDRLHKECKEQLLYEAQEKQITFVCIGASGVGKSTVIGGLGLEAKEKENGRIKWSSKSVGEVEIHFYEYSLFPSSPLSIPEGPRYVVLFSKYLQEQTGDFILEVHNAKRISEELNCKTLIIYTFSDQTSFPFSFASMIHKEQPKLKRKQLQEAVSNSWRARKDEAISKIFGKPIPSVCCSCPFNSTLQNMEEIIYKLCLIMSSKDIPPIQQKKNKGKLRIVLEWIPVPAMIFILSFATSYVAKYHLVSCLNRINSLLQKLLKK